ncbi:hypothetical protein [Bradyrhizobium canariense]|uniref:Uncharacterized protein n=1 Tax=Bradyrhizobium canariense TaxID=255045 RepID=A0A1X3G1N3_9BRAD|nr:hypothetical protein [Bradyrhizobium canariense]OSI73298.1 hypothetical protein BSZ22_07790 [Bradyrhizobium canariense]OSI79020.1 hypothetical protein BSZ23_16470 [Bradyrhizobium canariense]OSI89948.1 hypothetical protein BSZ25_19410 [Bradyrhizobium canariense]OSI92664.1 hypothetical protein BSZ24_14355 [Bradyrhizobium canariense]OSJ08260.1 hypothetical protein BSZ16_07615 [Bradyrhizobium canariense]
MIATNTIGRKAFKVDVTPSEGDPYKVDLSEFALGCARTKRSAAYSGRPLLARQIAAFFETENPTQHRAKSMRGALRQLFRYLDWRSRKCGEVVVNCAEIKDSHGPELLRWLSGQVTTFTTIRSVLNGMRALNGLRPLFWPSARRPSGNYVTTLDEQACKLLFRTLRHEADAIKKMFAQGDRLASNGEDPRARRHGWKDARSRAWMVRHLVGLGALDQNGLPENGATGLVTQPGPDYLAPGMKPRDVRGLVGNLRWFVPSRSDTGVFLWMFLLGTGWNLSTACGIDVMDPDGWCQPHPQNERFTVIHAFKRRSRRHQFAISMTRPEWHPYRILEFIVKCTAPLRKRVLRDLAEAHKQAAANPSTELLAEIKRLDRLSRTPWLFVGRGSAKTVSGFTANGRNRGLLNVARIAARRAQITNDYSELSSIVTKDARHVWMGHAYVHSRYHLVITKIAGNHASLRSTRHYIRSHRYRAHSEGEIRKVHNAFFSEIGSGRVVDPTRLRLLVEHGKITKEQDRRLRDYQQRTRIGMGCLDPRSPPKEIDPDHPEGAICRVQRCTGCPHGMVFPESLPALARRQAELLQLKRTMPLTSWVESSLCDEYESIEQTLAQFEGADVSAEIAAWTAKLESGEIAVHVTYPSY